MKKLLTIFTVFLLSFQVFAADFAIHFMPEYYFPLNGLLMNAPAGKIGFDFSPITNIRGRDSINISANVGLVPLMASGLENYVAYEGSGSLGYTFRFSDRFNASLEGYGGIWIMPGNNDSSSSGSKLSSASSSGSVYGGALYGARAGVNYYVLPELQLGLFTDFGILATDKDPLLTKISVGVNFRYSISEGLFSSSKIQKLEEEKDQLFPVFYSYYDDHPFGALTFQNSENNDITDVSVTVYIEQFMSNPDTSFTVDRVRRGESFTAPLTAFLNENILNTMNAAETIAQVTVHYKSLGKRKEFTQSVALNTVSRNSMTWEDDRRAAAFVSGRDASAYTFAQRVKSIVHDYLSPSVPENIQYAAAMFSALKIYGINYVIDPASAFTDNVGTASVDFLQFPYQTLLNHGGDCDDLTILNCALLEAIGIRTAFITVPGHIYMAFDSGVKPEEADKTGNHVTIGDTVWIPLEITLCQDTFEIERATGYREFLKFGNDSVIIPLNEAWNEYNAVCMSDSDVKLEYPVTEAVINEFKKQTFIPAVIKK